MQYNFLNEQLILSESFMGKTKDALRAINHKPLDMVYKFVKNNVHNDKKGFVNAVKRKTARGAARTFGITDAVAVSTAPPMPSPDEKAIQKFANAVEAMKGNYEPALNDMKEVADAGIAKSMLSFAKRTSALDQIFITIPGVIHTPQPFGAVLRGLGISSVDCINMFRDYYKACYHARIKPSIKGFVTDVTQRISKMFSGARNLNPAIS